jgi:hypothetical protein
MFPSQLGVPVVLVQTSTTGTHTQTTYSHIPNKQLYDANEQISTNSTKHGRRSPEYGQAIVTETFRVLMMCFTNILNFFM